MTPTQQAAAIDGMILRHFADPFTGSVAEWATATDPETGEPNLRFDEAGNRGPFRTTGREYIIEPLNDWGDRSVADCVEVWGSQTGKTGMLMAGAAWTMTEDPCGVLWVMPSRELAQSFSEQRWSPMLRASVATRGLIPTGNARFDFKKLQQTLGAAAINFVGSNSPGQLASRPVRKVILDEVDKFDTGGNREADAVDLAMQRTKGQAFPQRRQTSTPTLIDGLIWQAYLKGDQRRFFVPCPLCGRAHPKSRMLVLSWSPRFTTMTKTGSEAFLVWDKEAKKPDGRWDLDRVERSARMVCPHCQGDILDSFKTRMIAGGEWRPTATAEQGFRSRQLSSLYAAAPETTWGKLAVKFLQAKASLLGLQGFINGDLAEPYESQDRQAERVELITSRLEVVNEWKKLGTVDCQIDHFWFVCRAWSNGNSQGIEAGRFSTLDDIRHRQEALKIDDVGMIVDSGFGARSDHEIYRQCARFCTLAPRAMSRPLAIGWMPSKGMPGRKRWKDTATGLSVPYYLRDIDPFLGTSEAGKISMSLFEFSGDFFEDILAEMRKPGGPYSWAVAESMATDEYWRHMDSKIKTAVYNRFSGRTTWEYRKRSQTWPDHMRDCEVMQIAAAVFFGLLRIEIEDPTNDRN